MSDPTRLLSRESDADSMERALLESLQHKGPGEAAKGAMWQQLTASAVVAGVVVTASPVAASGALAGAAGSKASFGGLLASVSALVPKALGVKLALAGAVAATSVGGYAAWKTQVPAPRRTAVTVETARVIERTPQLEPPVALPAAEAALPEAPAETLAPVRPARHKKRGHVASSADQRERLLEESKLLASARTALRAHDLTQTDALLTRLGREFPRGELLQEREVLRIETLHAHGDVQAAQQRAEAFLQRHPESPHNATLRRFLSVP